jgi:hypothetical protein
LATNEKKKESQNFCWCRILVVMDFNATPFFLVLASYLYKIYFSTKYGWTATPTPTATTTATATGQWLSSAMKLMCQW